MITKTIDKNKTTYEFKVRQPEIKEFIELLKQSHSGKNIKITID
jgi:hypothetical protein